MAKLLVSEKDYICKHITDQLKEKIEERKNYLERYMEEKISNFTPAVILNFAAHYPVIVKEETISWRECKVLYELSNYSIYVYVRYIPFKEFDFKKIFDSDSKAEDLKNEIISLKKKSIEITNKTKCALEHISTHKKLKEQFPEAYAILIKEEDNVKSENECDAIENLRAELNSVNKS